MNNSGFVFRGMRMAVFAAMLVGMIALSAAPTKVKPGVAAPDFTLQDSSGQSHTLSEYIDGETVLVLEWFNPNCVYDVAHYDTERRTMQTVFEKYKDRGVVWLAINSGSVASGTRTDLTGDGDYLDTEEAEERAHNEANEIDRRYDEHGTPANLAYDKNGNVVSAEGNPYLFTDVTTHYVYDAWNRLVSVNIVNNLTIQSRARFTYYGGHQRATSTVEDEYTAPYDPDVRSHFYYDTSWRLLERRIDDDYSGTWTDGGSAFSADEIQQYIWGNRYIDELVLVQSAPDDLGFSGHEGYFALGDRNFSVLALADVHDDIIEHRTRYTAYGKPFTEPRGDVNGDGSRNFADIAAVNANNGVLQDGSGNYSVDADLDLNGVIGVGTWSGDTLDRGIASGSPAISAGWDMVSTAGCLAGYTGHIYEPQVSLCHARHRWLDSDQGRWVSRDPVGYVDGINLYSYVRSAPVHLYDPSGQAATRLLLADAWVFEFEANITASLGGLLTLTGAVGFQTVINCSSQEVSNYVFTAGGGGIANTGVAGGYISQLGVAYNLPNNDLWPGPSVQAVGSVGIPLSGITSAPLGITGFYGGSSSYYGAMAILPFPYSFSAGNIAGSLLVQGSYSWLLSTNHDSTLLRLGCNDCYESADPIAGIGNLVNDRSMNVQQFLIHIAQYLQQHNVRDQANERASDFLWGIFSDPIPAPDFLE